MKQERFEHIRDDVHTAILESGQHDPPVTLEILFRLLDHFGEAATADSPDAPTAWAERVLEEVQLRATSKIPFGEPGCTCDPGPEGQHRYWCGS